MNGRETPWDIYSNVVGLLAPESTFPKGQNLKVEALDFLFDLEDGEEELCSVKLAKEKLLARVISI